MEFNSGFKGLMDLIGARNMNYIKPVYNMFMKVAVDLDTKVLLP